MFGCVVVFGYDVMVVAFVMGMELMWITDVVDMYSGYGEVGTLFFPLASNSDIQLIRRLINSVSG